MSGGEDAAGNCLNATRWTVAAGMCGASSVSSSAGFFIKAIAHRIHGTGLFTHMWHKNLKMDMYICTVCISDCIFTYKLSWFRGLDESKPVARTTTRNKHA